MRKGGIPLRSLARPLKSLISFRFSPMGGGGGGDPPMSMTGARKLERINTNYHWSAPRTEEERIDTDNQLVGRGRGDRITTKKAGTAVRESVVGAAKAQEILPGLCSGGAPRRC